VHEVFISKKVNRRGHRFGFVRFSDVKNARRLKYELDTIRIGAISSSLIFLGIEDGVQSPTLTDQGRTPR